MSSTQRMIAEHEISFREENERIQAAADSAVLLGRIPFVCECPRPDCSDVVLLTYDEYEAIRQHPRRFFNVPGHERDSVAADAEVILAVLDRFTVVEKIGLAGDLAAAAHEAAGS